MRLGDVARSQAYLVGAHAGRVLLFFATLAILGHTMAPADFGFFVLVSSLFVIVHEALDLGTGAVTVRAVAQDPATESRRLATVLAWRRSMALAIAALVAAAGASAFDGDRRLAMLAAAAVVACMGWTTYHLVFQLRHAWGAALALALTLQAGFLLAGATALSLGIAGSAIALLVVVREFAQLGISRRIASRILGGSLLPGWRDPEVADLLIAAWRFGLAALCFKLSAHAGAFLSWAFGSPDTAGSFGAAHRLVMPAIELSSLFVAPVAVLLARDASRRPANVRRELGATLECMAGAGAVLAVCVASTAPLLVALCYGGRYGEPSQDALRVLVVGAAFAMATPILGVTMLAVRRERAVLGAAAAGLAANVAVAAIAAPDHGASGAAFGTAVGQGTTFVLLLMDALRTGWARARRGWLYALLPALALAAVVVPLSRWPALQFVAALVLGTGALVVLWSLPEVRASRAARAKDERAARDAALPEAAT